MGEQDEHDGNKADSSNENKNINGNVNGNRADNGNNGNRPYPRKKFGEYKGKNPNVPNSRVPSKSIEKHKKKEDLSEVIERRNKRIEAFFKLVGISVRVIGDENSPAIVYDDTCILNAYVHNFELRFTDNHNDGNIIYTVKLTESPNFDKNRVMNCINDYEKRPVYKVAVKGSNPRLYLSGYNFLNRTEKLGRYPVFSAYAPKVYFTKEKTDEICDELNVDGYSLESC